MEKDTCKPEEIAEKLLHLLTCSFPEGSQEFKDSIACFIHSDAVFHNLPSYFQKLVAYKTGDILDLPQNQCDEQEQDQRARLLICNTMKESFETTLQCKGSRAAEQQQWLMQCVQVFGHLLLEKKDC